MILLAYREAIGKDDCDNILEIGDATLALQAIFKDPNICSEEEVKSVWFLLKMVFPCLDKQLNEGAQTRWKLNNTCHFDVLASRWPHTLALGITIMRNCSDLNNIKENINIPIRKGRKS